MRLFVLLLFLYNCNKLKDFKYPVESFFQFEQNSIQNINEFLEKKRLLSSSKYCEQEFNLENLEISKINQEKFLNSKNQFLSIPYKSFQFENEFAISYNCCPTEVCKYSKILNFENEKLISEEKINGNLIYFDSNHYKILDDSISGLIFILNRKKELEYILDNVNMPIYKFNSNRSITLLKEFEIKLLKNKNSHPEDSIYKKLIIKENSKIYILEEDERFYFIFFKSDEKSIENILLIFEDEAENSIKKIQAIPISSKTELKSILKEKYFQFGFIEKSIFE